MEVKHPHHVGHKKKWNEYLLEFAMLFLAVFLGFLAEYRLEHTIEKDREKEYMVTMKEDLLSDGPLLDSTMAYWQECNRAMDSVADGINRNDLVKVYRHIAIALNPFSFRYNDRTITQLKNAGGFRLLRNKKVANLIIAYDQFNNNEMMGIMADHAQSLRVASLAKNKVYSQQTINAVYARYKFTPVPMSANPWLDSLVHADPAPLSGEAAKASLYEFKNALLAYRLDCEANVFWSYGRMKTFQRDLVKLLDQEYDLE